jgi:hypothetical protein
MMLRRRRVVSALIAVLGSLSACSTDRSLEPDGAAGSASPVAPAPTLLQMPVSHGPPLPAPPKSSAAGAAGLIAAAGSGGSAGASLLLAGAGGSAGAAGSGAGAGGAAGEDDPGTVDPLALFGLGSAGAAAVSCTDLACFELADCANLYPDENAACHFTRCEDLTCK